MSTSCAFTLQTCPRQQASCVSTYRTDGRFAWPDASVYYAQRHGVAPYPPLLAAIRAADYRPPRTDLASRMRAEQALFAQVPA